jgi:predicted RNA-binding Zn ribbon-like protein
VSTSVNEHRTAPGELAVVHAFLNTTFANGSRERFDTPERLQDWLVKRSLLSAATRVSRTDLDTVRALRTALRTILGPDDDQVRQHQLEALNGIVRQVPLMMRFDDAGRPGLVPGGSGVQGAIGHILAAIAMGQAEGLWSRMKRCRNEECQQVFYDTSKNHSAVWCSSQRCGNRMAARAYRARANSDV